jgi:hypothetical protein
MHRVLHAGDRGCFDCLKRAGLDGARRTLITGSEILLPLLLRQRQHCNTMTPHYWPLAPTSDLSVRLRPFPLLYCLRFVGSTYCGQHRRLIFQAVSWNVMTSYPPVTLAISDNDTFMRTVQGSDLVNELAQ